MIGGFRYLLCLGGLRILVDILRLGHIAARLWRRRFGLSRFFLFVGKLGTLVVRPLIYDFLWKFIVFCTSLLGIYILVGIGHFDGLFLIFSSKWDILINIRLVIHIVGECNRLLRCFRVLLHNSGQFLWLYWNKFAGILIADLILFNGYLWILQFGLNCIRYSHTFCYFNSTNTLL